MKNRILFGIKTESLILISLAVIIIATCVIFLVPNGTPTVFLIKIIATGSIFGAIFIFPMIIANGWVTKVPDKDFHEMRIRRTYFMDK